MNNSVKGDFDTMTVTQADDLPMGIEYGYAQPRAQSCCASCSLHAHHHSTPHTQVIHHSYQPKSDYNVVPLPLLGRHAALAECPGCKEVGPTMVRYENGKGTHWMGVFFFLFTGVGVFIPYTMKHFKNAEHSCMKCGRALAAQRFGGGTKAYLM